MRTQLIAEYHLFLLFGPFLFARNIAGYHLELSGCGRRLRTLFQLFHVQRLSVDGSEDPRKRVSGCLEMLGLGILLPRDPSREELILDVLAQVRGVIRR